MQQECPHCNVLTSDQWAQLATSSYKLRKEKHDSKSGKSDKKEESCNSSSLIEDQVCTDQVPSTSITEAVMQVADSDMDTDSNADPTK